MARIRISKEKYLDDTSYKMSGGTVTPTFIMRGQDEIFVWDYDAAKWISGETTNRKGRGRFYNMYNRAEPITALELLIKYGIKAPDADERVR